MAPWHFQQFGMCNQQSLRSAFAYALEYSMSVELLTKHHLEFLSIKGGCTGSSESTLVKMPHCWKLHVATHLCITIPVLKKTEAKIL